MKALAVFLVMLGAVPALAQQPSAPDPEIIAYQQLLSEANGRVAAASAQIAKLGKRVQELEAAAKSKPPEAPAK